jgi:hypothetical protein
VRVEGVGSLVNEAVPHDGMCSLITHQGLPVGNGM